MNSHQKDRQSLLQKLLDSVKQCQVNFGGKIVLATEKDSSVACLITQFEQAFLHGLKKNKLMGKLSSSLTEPLRQVTQKIIPEIDTTYWPLVRRILGPTDVKHFECIDGITTEAGRARVWLRSSLNEKALERHLNTILANKILITQHYEPWALLCDEEISSTLPTMARGLSSIIFAFDIKNIELNRPFKVLHLPQSPESTRKVETTNLRPVFANFDTEPSISKKVNKKKKKRKVLNATISDLEDIPGEHRYARSYSEEDFIPRSYSDDQESYVKSDDSKKELEVESKPNIKSPPLSPLNDEFSIDDSDSRNSTSTSIHSESTHSEFFLAKGGSENSNRQQEHHQQNIQQIDNNKLQEQLERQQDTLQQQLYHNESQNLHKDEDQTQKNDFSKILRSSYSVTRDENLSVKLKSMGKLSSSPDTNKYFPGVSSGNVDFKYMIDSKNEIKDIQNKTTGDINNSDKESHSDVDMQRSNRGQSLSEENSNEDIEVGSESSKYMQLFMAYDHESSQAASDTLALMTSLEPVFINHTEYETPPESSAMEKYVPSQESLRQKEDRSSKDLTTDLKQAILATAKRKEEIELQNKALQSALEQQREEAVLLRAEKERLEKEKADIEESNQKKIADLTREIDVLKNQLKKYVAAVQTLRKKDDTESPLNETNADVTLQRTNSESNNIFEEKLSQMAELHGELLEFQENLQRQLAARENCIVRMKNELVSLRGPLPDEITQHSMNTSQESLYTASRPLINIWIPSVFLKGRGADAHHLYQIYVRVGDEEWNLYRRYSQFNKLHAKVCKMYVSMEKFNFPKKKVFGKKDVKFVEERRKRLQEYLRLLINTTLSNNKELSMEPSKSLLVQLLPFFGELLDNGGERKKQQKEKNSPVYTGLDLATPNNDK